MRDRHDGPGVAVSTGHHKLAHKKLPRFIAIGPRGQEIVKKYLKPNTQAYLFSPREAVAAYRAEQRASRKAPVQPSQENRKKASPKRRPGDKYTNLALAGAIGRACRKANLPAWHLHQLRHSKGTEIQREFGLDASRAALGHRSANITTRYAAQDVATATEVARKLG
jgi:integrase